MVLTYESCRIARITKGLSNLLIRAIKNNSSEKGLIYSKKKVKKGHIDLRIFFIGEKNGKEFVEFRTALDTPYPYLDYFENKEETQIIRNSRIGRIVIINSGVAKDILLIFFPKTRSRRIIMVLNRLFNKILNQNPFLEGVGIDVNSPRVHTNLDHIWAKNIRDAHDNNASVGGIKLEQGDSYNMIRRKGGYIGSVKKREGNLIYGVSEEGLVWISPKGNIDVVEVAIQIVEGLITANALN